MPPKTASVLALKLLETRTGFSDELATSIVEKWAERCSTTLVHAETAAQTAAANTLARGAAVPEEVPADVADVLSTLHSTYSNLYAELQTVQSAIVVRVPEIKEEDNLGVNVQLLVLKELGDLEKRILGGGADSSSAPTINFPREYYAARAAIEEKLLGSGKPDEKPSASPSLRRQLLQLDYDTLVKAALAFAGLASRLRSVVAAFTLNSKKLMNPRSSNDRMIS
jgi:hypothetical protein